MFTGGGSKWRNMHERVQGRNVPLHQTQGDTWGRMLAKYSSKDFQPTHIFLSGNGNDICETNDGFYHKLRFSTVWHILIDSPLGPSKYYEKKHRHDWFDERCIPPGKPKEFDVQLFVKNRTANLKLGIDNVGILTKQFPECKIFALGCFYRKHWFPAISDMVPILNRYMREKHGISVVQMNGFLQEMHMNEDTIHLNHEGYKLLISKAIGPMCDSYYAINSHKTHPRLNQLIWIK